MEPALQKKLQGVQSIQPPGWPTEGKLLYYVQGFIGRRVNAFSKIPLVLLIVA